MSIDKAEMRQTPIRSANMIRIFIRLISNDPVIYYLSTRIDLAFKLIWNYAFNN